MLTAIITLAALTLVAVLVTAVLVLIRLGSIDERLQAISFDLGLVKGGLPALATKIEAIQADAKAASSGVAEFEEELGRFLDRLGKQWQDDTQQNKIVRQARETEIKERLLEVLTGTLDEKLAALATTLEEKLKPPAATPGGPSLPTLEQLADWAKQVEGLREKFGPLVDLVGGKGGIPDLIGKVLKNGTQDAAKN